MAYELRISDWSSDVCSSDLDDGFLPPHRVAGQMGAHRHRVRRAGGRLAAGGLGRPRHFALCGDDRLDRAPCLALLRHSRARTSRACLIRLPPDRPAWSPAGRSLLSLAAIDWGGECHMEGAHDHEESLVATDLYDLTVDRKSTSLNSSHKCAHRMP